MKNMNSLIIIVVATAASVLLASCGSGSNGKNIIVLVDFSTSINQEVRDWYIQTIEKEICANLTQFDRIKILPIDGASQTASRPLLQLDLFEHRDEWKAMGLNANETSQLKKKAFAKFMHLKMEELKVEIADAKVHRKKAGNATDILGAISVAQDDFSPEEDNVIIIMSDMEQYADKLKMSAKGKAADWLDQTTDAKFANISQFSVVVITGEQMGMSKAYYNEISNYWNSFFTSKSVKSLSYMGADASQLKLHLTNH